MDLIECLMKAGFTRHESILYVALCREGELTGYEASKISGIPRSNTYLALAGLVEKGAAEKIEGAVLKFTAVPIKELTANIKRQLNEVLNFLEKNTPARDTPAEAYITINGTQNIINKMKSIIELAAERIYLSVSTEELVYINVEIDAALERGLKVVIITTQGFDKAGAVIHYNDKQPGQIRLIADSTHVLTGEINSGSSSTCLYSKNKNLIQLIKDSLTNEIKLIQLKA